MALLRHLYHGLLSAYLVLALVWFILWKTLGDRNGILYLLHSLAFWILGGAWLASWLRFARSAPWLAFLLNDILGLVWLRHYAWMLWRRLPDPRPHARTPVLRILSANLLKKNRDLRGMCRYLQQQPVDIAVLQEVTADAIATLCTPLRNRFPHQYWTAHPLSRMGLGVLSRHPLVLEGRWSLPLGGPFGLRLRVVRPDQDLILYNVHLISPLYVQADRNLDQLLVQRNHQSRQLLDDAREARGHGESVVLMGDWNTTEGSEIHRQARRLFRDGWATAGIGPGWTWPHNLEPHMSMPARPFLRLDHAFCSHDIEVVQAQVVQPMGSDHSPLLLSIRLPAKD